MSIFSRFPYTDFHRLNADWILDKVKEAAEAVAESLGLVRQSAADAAAAAAAAEQAVDGSVRYDRNQNLTTLQQGQARVNIQAAAADMPGAVRYDQVQLLSENTRARACSNIRAVSFDSNQQLNPTYQAQARDNIQAAAADMPGAVRYDSAQQLTTTQQGQARDNIAAAPSDMRGAVRYDQQQILSAEAQQTARDNIGAASAAMQGAVRYDSTQTLSTTQKNRARENIGALKADDPSVLNLYISEPNAGQDIQIGSDSPASGPVLTLEGSNQSSSGLDVRISGVAAPTAGNDAATKGYVDGLYFALNFTVNTTVPAPTVTGNLTPAQVLEYLASGKIPRITIGSVGNDVQFHTQMWASYSNSFSCYYFEQQNPYDFDHGGVSIRISNQNSNDWEVLYTEA